MRRELCKGDYECTLISIQANGNREVFVAQNDTALGKQTEKQMGAAVNPLLE